MPLGARARASIRESLRATRALATRRIEAMLEEGNLRLEGIPLPQEGDPSEPPLERLRRFARLLDAAWKRLDSPEFGRCGACGGDVPEAELVEVPWADRCRGCPPGSRAL